MPRDIDNLEHEFEERLRRQDKEASDGRDRRRKYIRQAVMRLEPVLPSLPQHMRKPVLDAMVARLEREDAKPWAGARSDVMDMIAQQAPSWDMDSGTPGRAVKAIVDTPERVANAMRFAAAAAQGLVTGSPELEKPAGDFGQNLSNMATNAQRSLRDIGRRGVAAAIPSMRGLAPPARDAGRETMKASALDLIDTEAGNRFYREQVVPEVYGENGRAPAYSTLERVGQVVPKVISGLVQLPQVAGSAIAGGPDSAMRTGKAMGADFAGYAGSLVRHPLDTTEFDPSVVGSLFPALSSASMALRAQSRMSGAGRLAKAGGVVAEFLSPSDMPKRAVKHTRTRPQGGETMALNERLDRVAGELPPDVVDTVRGKAGLEGPTLETSPAISPISSAERIANTLGRGARGAGLGALMFSGIAGPEAAAMAGAFGPPAMRWATRRANNLLVPKGIVLNEAERAADLERKLTNPNAQGTEAGAAVVEDVTVTPPRDVQGGRVIVGPLAESVKPTVPRPGETLDMIDIPAERTAFEVRPDRPDEMFQQPESAALRAANADINAISAQQEALISRAESDAASKIARDEVAKLGEDIGEKPAKQAAASLRRTLYRWYENMRAAAKQRQIMEDAFPGGRPPSTAAEALLAVDIAQTGADRLRESMQRRHGRGTKGKPNPNGKSPVAELAEIQRREGDMREAQKVERALEKYRDALSPDEQVAFDLARQAADDARQAEAAFRAVLGSTESKEAQNALRRLYELEKLTDGKRAASLAATIERGQAVDAFDAFPGGRSMTHQELMGKAAAGPEASAAKRADEIAATREAAVMERNSALKAFHEFDGGRAMTREEMLGQAIDVAEKRAKADEAMKRLGKNVPEDAANPAATAEAWTRNVQKPKVLGSRLRGVAQLYDVDAGTLAATVSANRATKELRRARYPLPTAKRKLRADVAMAAINDILSGKAEGKRQPSERMSLPQAARRLRAQKDAKQVDAVISAFDTHLDRLEDATIAAPDGSVAAVEARIAADAQSQGVRDLARGAGAVRAASAGVRASDAARRVVVAEAALSKARVDNPAGTKLNRADLAARMARQEAALELAKLSDDEKSVARIFIRAYRRQVELEEQGRALAQLVAERATKAGQALAAAVSDAVDKADRAGSTSAAAKEAASKRGAARELLPAEPEMGLPAVEGLVTDRGSSRLHKVKLDAESEAMVQYLANIVEKAPKEGIGNARELIEATLAKAMSETSTIAALSPRMVGKLSKDFLGLLEAAGLDRDAIAASESFKAWASSRSVGSAIWAWSVGMVGKTPTSLVDAFLRSKFEKLLVDRVQGPAVLNGAEVVPIFRFGNGVEIRLDTMIAGAYEALGPEAAAQIQKEALRKALNTVLDQYLTKTTSQSVGRELVRSQGGIVDAMGNLAGPTVLAADAIFNHTIGAQSNLLMFDPSPANLASTTVEAGSAAIIQSIFDRHGVRVTEQQYAAAVTDMRTSFVEAGSELSQTAKSELTSMFGAQLGKDVKVFARYGYNESVNTHLLGLKVMRDAQNIWAAIGQHGKVAVTAGSMSALSNNVISNSVLGTLMMGTAFPVEYAAAGVKMKQFESGNLVGAEARKWRSIVGSGIVDSSVLHDVGYDRVSWSATNPVSSQLWSQYWDLRSHGYKQIDGWSKAAMTSMHYDAIASDLAALENGRYIALDTGKGKHQILSKDDAGQLRLDGRAIDAESQELSDAIGRQARHTAADVLFDFTDMGLIMKKFKQGSSGFSALQPLASWFFKALEKPDGYGIIGHALHFDPRSKYLTDSPTLMNRKAVSFAKLAGRRLSLSALQQSMESSANEAFGPMMAFGSPPALSLFPNTRKDAGPFSLLAINNSPSDFEQPMMIQAESIFAVGKAAADLLGSSEMISDFVKSRGGVLGNQSAMSSLQRQPSGKMARVPGNQVTARDFYVEGAGRRNIIALGLRMMQLTGDFSRPFVEYQAKPTQAAAGAALRSAAAILLGGDAGVLSNVALAKIAPGSRLTSIREGESLIRYILSATTRLVAREINPTEKLAGYKKRTTDAFTNALAGLPKESRAIVSAMWRKQLDTEIARARQAVGAIGRRENASAVHGEMRRR